MAKIEKLLERLPSRPTDFTSEELIKVLNHFGYLEFKKGKTGGSRRKFVDSSNNCVNLHKPHPGNILKRYMLDDIINHLKARGKIENE